MCKLREVESVIWLKSIADYIWRDELVPGDWKKQVIILLHKNGCRTICDNYCDIALLSVPSKAFAEAILNCLKARAELLTWWRLCQ